MPISAAIDVQRWTVSLVEDAMTAEGLDHVDERVTVDADSKTPRPYAIVKFPHEQEDEENSDCSEYAAEVRAEVELYGERMGQIAEIAGRIIDSSEAHTPPTGWTVIIIQLAQNTPADVEDENVTIYGRVVTLRLRLSKARTQP